MKKYLAILLVSLLAVTMFAGCKNKAETDKETEAKTVKTGLAVITSQAKSADAGEADGFAQVDSAVVALTLDSSGKIIKCVIDSAQSKILFNTQGQLVTPMDTLFETKNELGDTYNMKRASGIGKEWYEQAAAFASYVEGKTVSEVKGIAVDAENHPTGSDLVSSVTMSVGDYVAAIEKAASNAKDYGASSSDKLSLGVYTTMGHSKGAGDEDGLAEAYSTYVAVTTDTAGKITSCIIDATQGNVRFDSSGNITSDTAAPIQTKNEKGDAYGMKIASGIGKEWYEQAAAFAEYVSGKTFGEAASITVDEKEVPTDSDLRASVTIGIGDFKAALAKAAGA
ncbi:MAG: hypothetical protein GX111_10435 [Clostridiales bacterium]|jgi:hypothetical protein|nr:hypothetical protein [Clostridiales bacterium]